MQGLPGILLLISIKFNKFNNTGAQMVDSIYHLTLKLLLITFFGLTKFRFCHIIWHYYDVIM